jgi:DHA3 family macrolide efflux protein-like MFS transporter
MSVAAEASRLIGPTLGGAMLGLLGMTVVVLADSLSFVFCALMILGISLPPRARLLHQADTVGISARHSFWRDWRLGLHLIGAEPVIRALFVVTGIAMLGEGTIRAVFVPFLSHVAAGNALVFGWVLTAQGVEGVLGVALAGTCAVIEASFPMLPVVLVCACLAGAPTVFFFVSMDTLLQHLVADRSRGRAFGSYNMTSTLLLLAGMLGSSVLTDHVGLFPMVAVDGTLYFLAGLVAFRLLCPGLLSVTMESKKRR